MAEQDFHGLLPYAVNSAVVLALLVLWCRKPFRKYIYQRHERMKDSFEAAAIAHQKALARTEAARKAVTGLTAEEAALAVRERNFASEEKAAILEKARVEASRIQTEADRLAAVEQGDASDRVKQEFVGLVVAQTEDRLRKGLKKDDHSAIVKRAQHSIEVGV